MKSIRTQMIKRVVRDNPKNYTCVLAFETSFIVITKRDFDNL